MADETRSGLSALVLNWRDTPRTIRCVSSLLESRLFERVLIVDNEAADDGDLSASAIELSDTRVEILPVQENRGFAGGVNLGLRQLFDAGFDQVLVINNDATIAPEDVQRLASEASRANSPTLLGPRIVYPDGTPQASGSRINWRNASVDHMAWPTQPDYLTWACVLVSWDLIETVGYLDESFFMYWEDADFSLRVRATGGEVRLVPDAVAIHEESATKTVIGNLTVRYATAALGTFARKYPRLGLAARYRILMRMGRQTLRHGLREGLHTFRAWRWGVKRDGTPAWKEITDARWAHL
jgi:GT2 family glycosyltransferase